MPLLMDPSRTHTLRRRFTAELTRRLRGALGEAVSLVVDEDAFGLQPRKYFAFNQQDYRFLTDEKKLEEFNLWLRGMLDRRLLDRNQVSRYWEEFITQGYEKGLGRSYDLVGKPALRSGEDLSFFKGSKREFLNRLRQNPEVAEQMRVLSSRAFNEIKGISDDMAKRMNRVLADGLARRLTVVGIARNLTREVGIAYKKAKVIANTEIVRAQAEGQLNALEALGINEAVVLAEFTTQRDGRVCPICAGLDGQVFQVSEAHGLIPVHPNCRCSFTLVRRS